MKAPALGGEGGTAGFAASFFLAATGDDEGEEEEVLAGDDDFVTADLVGFGDADIIIGEVREGEVLGVVTKERNRREGQRLFSRDGERERNGR